MCILRRSSLVQQIVARLHLPSEKIEVHGDDHYKCKRCLARLAKVGYD
jgi:hypothetical protein